MYIQTNPGLGQVTTTLDINKAIRNNRIYGQQLGWWKYYDDIAKFLGFTIRPSESEFAQGVTQWQQSQGLRADGILGLSTWAVLLALRTPTQDLSGLAQIGTNIPRNICTKVKQKEILHHFKHNDVEPESAQWRQNHLAAIGRIALCVREQKIKGDPIRSLKIFGHASTEGDEARNKKLGKRRAERVAKELSLTLKNLLHHLKVNVLIDHQGPGSENEIVILTDTKGESESVGIPFKEARRVEILIPKKEAPPKPKPKPQLNPERWTRIMSAPELRSGNFVNFLIDGQVTYRAMHDAIRTATGEGHYIYLLGWWLDDNVPLGPPLPGLTLPPPAHIPPRPSNIRNLFIDASRRGVQIRAMLWDQKKPPNKNTAEVQQINALAKGAAILDDHTLNFGSQHQKVLVVKGEKGLIAFCGGLDINWDRVAASGPNVGPGSPQHDIHCQIIGPAAHDLLQTFIRRWDAHPRHTAIDRSKKGDLLGRSERPPARLSPRPVGHTGGNCAVRITRTYNPVTPLAPGTSAVRETSIRDTLIAAIKNAQRFIYIEDQYLVNMEAAALLNAALSHIKHLTIMIPDSRISDLPRVWEGRLNFIQRLTSGPNGHKARVFIRVNPESPNDSPTCAPPNLGSHTYVHAKTWIIDDELAIIGTANCNQRGWSHDSEVNAVIFEDRNPDGLTFAQRLRVQLWAEHLNVSPARVRDGIASLPLWIKPPPGGHICPYDPHADKDLCQKKGILCVPWSVIDPAGLPEKSTKGTLIPIGQ